MVKKILFVCKHNLFRSQVARTLFNKYNKNKRYVADGAGVIKWDKKDLGVNAGFRAEKKACKEKGIILRGNSKGLSSTLLNATDILIIVADNVHPSIFKNDRSFNGKLFVWKIPDVKDNDRNKEKIAHKTIKFIDKKVKKFVGKLK